MLLCAFAPNRWHKFLAFAAIRQLLVCVRRFAFFTTTAALFTFHASAQTDNLAKENIKANLKTVDTARPAVYKINTVSTVIISAAATAANMIAINNVLHNKPDLNPGRNTIVTPRCFKRL